MAISINPVLPVLAAQEAGSVAPDLVLQPGSVVNAQVLKVLSADLVRIAIASLSIDVAVGNPAQEGQTLQLAVSQTQGWHPARRGRAGRQTAAVADAVTLSPEALIDAAANPPTITAAPRNVLTPAERAAVSTAAQAAATEQDSLAPLFANLGAVAASGSCRQNCSRRSRRCWRNRPVSIKTSAAATSKTAFQKSGLFLEASLATGAVPSSGGLPDLKAALIVLRQALQSALGTAQTTPTRRRPRERRRCRMPA